MMSTMSYSLDKEHLSYMTMLWLKQSRIECCTPLAGQWPGYRSRQRRRLYVSKVRGGSLGDYVGSPVQAWAWNTLGLLLLLVKAVAVLTIDHTSLSVEIQNCSSLQSAVYRLRDWRLTTVSVFCFDKCMHVGLHGCTIAHCRLNCHNDVTLVQ